MVQGWDTGPQLVQILIEIEDRLTIWSRGVLGRYQVDCLRKRAEWEALLVG